MSRLTLTLAGVRAPRATSAEGTYRRAGWRGVARRLLAVAVPVLGGYVAATVSFGSASTTSPPHAVTVAPVYAVPMPAAVPTLQVVAAESVPHLWSVYRTGVR